MSHPYIAILEHAKTFLEQGKEKYFCGAAFDLLRSGAITKELNDAFREWIHRMLHPLFSSNYYDWMAEHHRKEWNYMEKHKLHLEARLAWANHLINFLETE